MVAGRLREYQGGKALGVRSVEQVGGAEKRRAEEQDNERHQGLRHGRHAYQRRSRKANAGEKVLSSA